MSKSASVPVPGMFGSVLLIRNVSTIPTGTLIMNSHGQRAIARIAPPIVGPAAAVLATIVAIAPVPRPNWFGG